MKRIVCKTLSFSLVIALVLCSVLLLGSCSDKLSGVYVNIVDGVSLEFYGSSFSLLTSDGARYEGRYNIDSSQDPHMISFSFDKNKAPVGWDRAMSFSRITENDIEYLKLGSFGYFYKGISLSE